jgi:hypothetical protein
VSETRKLAAILVSDVVGYSRLAGADEDRTLSRLRGLRSDLIDPAISAHHGRVVKRTGDGAIVEFRSVVDAVNCAIELQRAMVERSAEVPPALKETASYVQKDGKTVTVDAKGRMRRTLPSGARDPEPIARIVRPHKRVREELIWQSYRPAAPGGVESAEDIPGTYSVQRWQLPFRPHFYSWSRRYRGRSGEVGRLGSASTLTILDVYFLSSCRVVRERPA